MGFPVVDLLYRRGLTIKQSAEHVKSCQAGDEPNQREYAVVYRRDSQEEEQPNTGDASANEGVVLGDSGALHGDSFIDGIGNSTPNSPNISRAKSRQLLGFVTQPTLGYLATMSTPEFASSSRNTA
jgi:hypothetical protein